MSIRERELAYVAAVERDNQLTPAERDTLAGLPVTYQSIVAVVRRHLQAVPPGALAAWAGPPAPYLYHRVADRDRSR